MLIRITSGDNSRIRLVRKLSTRKGRSTEGRFAVEGRNLVSEVLGRGLDVEPVAHVLALAIDGTRTHRQS